MYCSIQSSSCLRQELCLQRGGGVGAPVAARREGHAAGALEVPLPPELGAHGARPAATDRPAARRVADVRALQDHLQRQICSIVFVYKWRAPDKCLKSRVIIYQIDSKQPQKHPLINFRWIEK